MERVATRRSCAWVFLVLVAAASAQDKPAISSPAKSSKAPPPRHGSAGTPDRGAIRDSVYRNAWFGFAYKIPFGWVDRTEYMRQDSENAGKSLVLLAVFERPPEATSDTVNSAVVVAAEPAAAYPGLKAAAQYFGPLAELTQAKGFQPSGEPYEFRVGSRSLVRGDFTRPRGSLTMCQSSLVMVERGYVVSFTVIGGSEDEVNQLIEGLSFSAR